MRIEPVFLFDLDGTLVDSVYQHVLAWKESLDAEGVDISVWRIHRKIGMSGGLFTNQLKRETGTDLSDDRLERLRHLHVDAYRRMSASIRPLRLSRWYRGIRPAGRRGGPARRQLARRVRRGSRPAGWLISGVRR